MAFLDFLKNFRLPKNIYNESVSGTQGPFKTTAQIRAEQLQSPSIPVQTPATATPPHLLGYAGAPQNTKTHQIPTGTFNVPATPVASGPQSTPIAPTPPPAPSAPPVDPALAQLQQEAQNMARYGTPISPQITPEMPPGAPEAPVVPPTPPEAPETDPEAPGLPISPIISPDAQTAYDAALESYQQALKISPEELSTQEDLDKLIESTKKGYQDIRDQTIPMQFITGQLQSLEERALNLAEPLERKLARLQAKRTSALEASKFALERAESQIEKEERRAERREDITESRRRFDIEQAGRAEERDIERSRVEQQQSQFEKTYQLSQEKFEEDKRQFGLQYAQDQQRISLTAAKQNAELAGNRNESEALDSYALVSELLNNPALPAISGFIGQYVGGILPGNRQLAKNQYNQIKAMLKLENRQKLKGQGQISDFEGRILADASSALGRNLSDEEFARQLRRVKGAFATAAGMEADVMVTNPEGESVSAKASREEINQLIKEGNTIDYL